MSSKEMEDIINEIWRIKCNLYFLCTYPKRATFGLEVFVDDLQRAHDALWEKWKEYQDRYEKLSEACHEHARQEQKGWAMSEHHRGKTLRLEKIIQRKEEEIRKLRRMFLA